MSASSDGNNLQALAPLLASVLDAVVIIDDAGLVAGWNDHATQTFGWTASEALGQPLDSLIIPPRHRKAHQAGMERYRTNGVAHVVGRRIEIDAIDNAGREFPVELAITDAAGLAGAAFVGFLRDISARRAEQDRMSLSEELLRLATEAAEIGTWDLDLATHVLTWSDRTKAMFGFSPHVRCSMDDFYAGLHPDDFEATSAAFASALEPSVRSTYDVQYRTIGKEDARLRWVAAKGGALFDEQGRCIRAIGTAIDITSQKLADARRSFMLELSDVLRGMDTDQSLHDACALMGGYFGVSRVGYGQLDPIEDMFDYSICWTDGNVPPLLGRLPAAAFGKKIVAKLGRGETVVVDDLFSDEISDEAQTRETAASVDTRAILVVPFLRAGRLRTIVYLNDRPARAWTQEEVDFMEEVAERTREVIERAEAEAAVRALNATLEARIEQRTQELRSTEEALRQAQKMEAIGQLTGGIAHDFNNLLQGITGNLDLINRRIEQGRTRELGRYLEGAATSAQRAAALTHRLLAFSRRQPLDPKPVRANPLICSIEDLLRRTLGEGIELGLALSDDLWLTRCDPNQLENAVLNLAINARDAMPDGGTLEIATENLKVEAANTAASGHLRAGEYIVVRVTDTGMGMDSDTVARAFEPFFTTKPTGQGTGLGLSMIYGFARQSEGHVVIESEVGRGTAVHVYLPRHESDEKDDEANAADVPSNRSAGEAVLVVEDEPIVRSLVVEVLAELGYEALEAADGPSGLEILQSDRRIDLLITDIGLPGLNGRQIADAARVKRPDLKVLLMTGYAEAMASPSGFLDQHMSLVTKPFTMDALAERIRALIDL